jgi:hypothetical protein
MPESQQRFLLLDAPGVRLEKLRMAMVTTA